MSSARISVTAEVVGNGSDGTEPSLLFSVQRHGLYSDDVKVLKRYLFNCGEGTQRLAGENGIKLSSVDDIYFTRFDVKSVSGVPGVIFALGSCGAAKLSLHGPVGLRGFLSGIRSFVRRKYPHIQCVEIVEGQAKLDQDAQRDIAESIECDTWSEGIERSDQHAWIIPIVLGGSVSSSSTKSQKCKLCEKNAPKRQVQERSSRKASRSTGLKQARDNQIGRRLEHESDEHERCREWLVGYYTAKVPAKLPYIDVVLNQYRGRYDDLKTQLRAKYGDMPSSTPSPSSPSSSDSSSDSDGDGDDDTTFNYVERPIDRRWLEKFYAEHQREKLTHIDRVLRQFSGREEHLKQMLLKKYGHAEVSARHPTVFNEGAPIKKRRLLEASEDDREKRSENQIPKIYADKSNLHESLPDNASSPLCYILQFQYAPYPIVWIIDCRTADHLADLERKFSAMTSSSYDSHCNAHLPSLVVHLSPAHVRAQPRYKQWIASLYSSTWRPKHLIFDGIMLQSVAQGAFGYAFMSSAKKAVRSEIEARSTSEAMSKRSQTTMSAIQELVNFLEDSSWSVEHPCRREIVHRIDGCNIEAHIAQAKLQFHLLHPKDMQLGFNYERTGWHQKADKSEDDGESEIGDNTVDKQLGSLSTALNQSPGIRTDLSSSRRLIVLGTGSAAPSKLRASSGMYLELSGANSAAVDSMLVDCGEGTFGQLWRQFGGNVSERIGGMRCIWISHNHADHHCGLVRILYEYWYFHTQRKNDNSSRPLVVVAPQSVLSYVESWLPHFLGKGSDQQLIRLVTCSDFNNPQHPIRYQLLSDIGYSVTSIMSVRVFHCYDSYGLVLTLHGGKKLVYSGDTKPCNELVLAGMGAELLVHEATFDDSMEQDAMKKKHSTVGQALDIARRMRVRQVVLTHFSQRYPSLPPPVSDSSEALSNTIVDVQCAYDGFVHPMPF